MEEKKLISKKQLDFVCDSLIEQVSDADYIGDLALDDNDRNLAKVILGAMPDIMWKHFKTEGI